jgi:tetratricopeptide (TPR) repeat protein
MNTPAFACASLPETASKHQRSSGRHGLGNDQLRAENSMTAAWMAQWQLFYMGQGWANHAEETLATVREYALKAVKLDPDNAEALGIYAHCCAYGDRDFDTAIKCFERASLLNPSWHSIGALSAMTYCYIGKPDIALQRLQRYHELVPPDLTFSWFESFYTVAYR